MTSQSRGRFSTASNHLYFLMACAISTPVLGLDASQHVLTPQAEAFLQTHCLDCHEGESSEAGLDLATLTRDLQDAATQQKWARIIDRVRDGEMPPKDAAEIAKSDRTTFVKASGGWLRDYQQAVQREVGRTRARRLTNQQLERTLQDLLTIDIPLASSMSEESRTGGFATVADGQAMSHFQLQQHMNVVDAALDESFRRALTPDDQWSRELNAQRLARRRQRSRTREPELIDGRAVTWSGRLVFYGRLPSTTAREDGWYRFTIRAAALNSPSARGVWCTVRSGRCVSSAPMMAWVGAFEATEDTQEVVFEAWLPQGHMLEVRPGDATLKRAQFRGGQVGTGEGGPQNVPGVALESIRVERIYHTPNVQRVRDALFDDLQVQVAKTPAEAKLLSDKPLEDAHRLLHRFATRAFRREVSDATIQPYRKMVEQQLESGAALHAALRTGYRAILASPRFLYFVEPVGVLDDYALASRLSYFLWDSMPDDELFGLAESNKLSDPAAIRDQVERMLSSVRGRQFVKDFAAEWLDLRLIDFTEPDRRLYPGFDVIVQQSMVHETQQFLQTMLDENLGPAHLVKSDFTFLNSRLARYYRIAMPNTKDSSQTMKRVTLAPSDHHGGLLTQGAIMKVTANGTTTSPVIRGVWVSERILGEMIPPPPENVPAIEPDVRGAKSIREMLARHRADSSCASCHTKIDPPGFALENFDPSGRWRERYATANKRQKTPRTVVDASYIMPDGQPFDSLQGFQRLVAKDEQRLARNVAEKLVVYSTGSVISFADRERVHTIADISGRSGYGLRSIVHAVCQSPLFLNK